MALDETRAHEATPGGTAVAEPAVADGAADLDKPWMTIVWDDPVNLMRYVTYVFPVSYTHLTLPTNREV